MKSRLVPVAVAVAAGALVPATAASVGEGDQQSAGSKAAATRTTITLRKSQYGPVLFDGRGRVLYGFTRDRRNGPSRCYGACAKAWPVFYATKQQLRAGKGVKQSLLGTTRRVDGRRQATYNGWPLYYYVDDGPGEVKCHNVDEFGGTWLVVRANGQLLR